MSDRRHDLPADDSLPELRWGPDGLIPVVTQDAETRAVLMVAFMNEEALAVTRATGRVHYWSRSRNALWRKGATSGHEQILEDLHVNCDRNSLLLTVRQLGAVCHDGYPTCYYRRVDSDGSLSITIDRAFDPALVYSDASLAAASALLYGAYAYLQDHDLVAVSRTSARLRAAESDVHRRLADELRELAGVLDGSHVHTDTVSDALLEGSQVLYWVILNALRAGVTAPELRLDRALVTVEDTIAPLTTARLLCAEAVRWAESLTAQPEIAPACHATLALLGQAIRVANLEPADLIAHDLADLRTKDYLAPYFAAPRL